MAVTSSLLTSQFDLAGHHINPHRFNVDEKNYASVFVNVYVFITDTGTNLMFS